MSVNDPLARRLPPIARNLLISPVHGSPTCRDAASGRAGLAPDWPKVLRMPPPAGLAWHWAHLKPCWTANHGSARRAPQTSIEMKTDEKRDDPEPCSHGISSIVYRRVKSPMASALAVEHRWRAMPRRGDAVGAGQRFRALRQARP